MERNIEEFFKTIYQTESDAIFRFCLTRVSDREQALDLTQETFLRFWKNLGAKNKIENPKAFLFTVARNLIIDWYRKKKSDSLDQLKEEGYDWPDEGFGNKEELKFEGKNLLEKIKELTPGHRDPVYLRLVEDLSPQEIAEILDLSANLVSVRINRGLEELRKITGYNI